MPRMIKLLHIEDDPMQSHRIKLLLGKIEELAFNIVGTESENASLQEFDKGEFQFVILDYHLTEGNGLSCLKKIRERDPLIPLVAISGVATPEIAAELLKAGADDYLSKKTLTKNRLAESVRAALARNDGLRDIELSQSAASSKTPEALFGQVCRLFAESVSPRYLLEFSLLESACRREELTASDIQILYSHYLERLNDSTLEREGLSMRPVVLELCFRLFGSLPSEQTH